MMKDLLLKQKTIKVQYKDQPASAYRKFQVKSLPQTGNEVAESLLVPSGHLDFKFHAGAHEFVGGDGTLPCPGDLLLAALASCMEISLRIVAANLGIEIAEVVITAKGDLDARGTLLMSKEVPVGFQNLECTARVKTVSEITEEKKAHLIRATEKCCSIMSTLRASNEIKASFEIK